MSDLVDFETRGSRGEAAAAARGSAVASVGRALTILAAFDVDRRLQTVTDMASLLGVHKSTASRLAATLARAGFISRAPDGDAFLPGPELARLGGLAMVRVDLVELAREPMEAVATATSETVTVAVAEGEDMLTVAQLETPYTIAVKSWVGRRYPVHATSDGKVMLAFGAATLPDGALERLTASTVTSREQLERELDDVRARGWAASMGEFERGLHGVAAPVFATSGRCVAALSVSGPSFRLPVETFPALAEECIRGARDLGARVAWRGDV